MIEEINIKLLIPHPNNPRFIRDDKFRKLVKSIKEFPEMLNLRPIIVDDNCVVLGGNMRLRACKEAGIERVPVIKAGHLTAHQQTEFIIKDNVGFGEWDYDILANCFDENDLIDWGIDLPMFAPLADEKEPSEPKESFIIEVKCADLDDREKQYNKLIEQGFSCYLKK
jgi:hypothetical protein